MKKTALVLLLILSTVFAHARKFYFSSSTGNDSYTATQAQIQATPWRTLEKISYYVINRGGNLGLLFQPGDTLAFKRGDVFANGLQNLPPGNWFRSILWWNDGAVGYYRAPSGTTSAPIVFTNYGDASLPLPNLLYPYPSDAPQNTKVVLGFYGVHDIVVDGLQFNDYRFPSSNKKDPAYTAGGIEIGQITLSKLYYNGVNITGGTCPVPGRPACDTVFGSNSNVNNRPGLCYNIEVKNCIFNNMSYGIYGVYAKDSRIHHNTFTNSKSTTDTTGTHDVLGSGIEACSGINLDISYNYFKGNWAKSGRNSSTQGVGGVGIDIFNLYNSRITYNTFVDGRHMMEIGNLDRYDSLSGASYDTFAYNKVINNTQIGYIHGAAGDPFGGNLHNLYFWNNVVIDNNKSRTSGPNYGNDMYGDGQSYNQFWFYSSPSLPNTYVDRSTTTSFSTGDNVLTLNSVTNVTGGNGTLLNWYVYQEELSTIFPQNNPPYVTSVNTTAKTVTLSSNALAGSSSGLTLYFYPPLSEKGVWWSQPGNPSISQYATAQGNQTLQYSTDSMRFGMGYDTLIDLRNNIFYNVNGLIDLYPDKHGWHVNNTTTWRNRFFHSNNVYYLKGGMYKTNPSVFYPSKINNDGVVTLGVNETSTQTMLFKDTSDAFPENWDLHPANNNLIVGRGSLISGITKDFAGIPLSGTPDIGLYKYSAKPMLALSSSTNLTCKTATNGTITVTASGGTGPYLYKMNNGAWQSSPSFSNLAAGTYIITVKDAKGATSTLTVTIKGSNIIC